MDKSMGLQPQWDSYLIVQIFSVLSKAQSTSTVAVTNETRGAFNLKTTTTKTVSIIQYFVT